MCRVRDAFQKQSQGAASNKALNQKERAQDVQDDPKE